MLPGAIAPGAAAINVPVFIGMSERDVCPQSLSDPQAYERFGHYGTRVSGHVPHAQFLGHSGIVVEAPFGLADGVHLATFDKLEFALTALRRLGSERRMQRSPGH